MFSLMGQLRDLNRMNHYKRSIINREQLLEGLAPSKSLCSKAWKQLLKKHLYIDIKIVNDANDAGDTTAIQRMVAAGKQGKQRQMRVSTGLQCAMSTAG